MVETAQRHVARRGSLCGNTWTLSTTPGTCPTKRSRLLRSVTGRQRATLATDDKLAAMCCREYARTDATGYYVRNATRVPLGCSEGAAALARRAGILLRRLADERNGSSHALTSALGSCDVGFAVWLSMENLCTRLKN